MYTELIKKHTELVESYLNVLLARTEDESDWAVPSIHWHCSASIEENLMELETLTICTKDKEEMHNLMNLCEQCCRRIKASVDSFDIDAVAIRFDAYVHIVDTYAVAMKYYYTFGGK